MDTITHALSGTLLARATSSPGNVLSTRARLVSGTLSSAFPDSDIVIRFFSDPVTYLNLHRGVTHSIVLLPVWALLLSWLYAKFTRGRYRWQDFFLITSLCLGIHILGDVITIYGTKIFMPFSHYRAVYGTTFIIDLIVTGILLVSLLLAWKLPRPALVARLGFMVLLGYIGLQAILKHQAEDIAVQYAQRQQLPDAQISVLPQPLSPFNWKLLVTEDNHYHDAYVNLLRRVPVAASENDGFFARINSVYQPLQGLEWTRHARLGNNSQRWALVEKVWNMEAFRGFRDFAVFPMLYEIQQTSPGITCVWFTDLRFQIKTMTPPFRFGMCGNEQDAVWKLKRLSRLDD